MAIIRASENDVNRIFQLVKNRFGNVDNTADSNKNVASASKLTTARKITLEGAVSGFGLFNGEEDISITTTLGSSSSPFDEDGQLSDSD